MLFTAALSSVAILSGLAAAAPAVGPRAFTIPTNVDNFPNPNADQLKIIDNLADGTLSNAPPPATLNPASFPIFQLVAFNENFEVAFFSSLIYNITNNVPGFELPSPEKKDELLDILETVLAQEKLHAINAINTLNHFKAFAPQPCKYQFPTTTVYDAIALAERFTDLVLSTLQDAAQGLAKNGDIGPVRGVASTLGQEGQQEGFYRILLRKKPSEKPFLTTNVGPFAFSALQQFIVPGSCPFDLAQIALPIFPPVSVISGNGGVAVDARDQHLSFQVDLTSVKTADKYVGGNGAGLFITYFSGQLLPISVPIINVKWSGRVATFEANFPFTENVMMGLSIASLTTANNFAAPGDVVAATLAAPGLIQVDDRVKSWDGF